MARLIPMFGRKRPEAAIGDVEPSPDAKRLTVRVSGYVQGVGFRWTVLSVAEPLGLLGYAENLPNGDVEVVAEGSAEACGQLLDWLSGRGPRAPRLPGRVESLAPSWGPARGGFRRFSIR